jgi:1-acyl-sn-glycerol-3-phosphate acyltransferase
MNKKREDFFKPIPLLSRGRAFLLRVLMLPNFLLITACGLENLSMKESPRIYAFNHNNSLEALMVPVFLIYHLGGRTISFVIDWMYGKIPVLGQLMNMIDPVYVYNKRSTLPWIEASRPAMPIADTVERCAQKLRAGQCIGIFPEGKRNKDPETLVRGKPGIGHIALQTGAAVVPIGIDFNCRSAKRKIPMIGRTIIRIGKPLHFYRQSEAYLALFADSHRNHSEYDTCNQLAACVTHEIMLNLAALSGKQYREPFPLLRQSLT